MVVRSIFNRAICALEGCDSNDLGDYLDSNTEKYRKMVSWIAKDIDVTTLEYQTLDDTVKAIGLPRERLCLSCWNGVQSQCKGAKENSRSSV